MQNNWLLSSAGEAIAHQIKGEAILFFLRNDEGRNYRHLIGNGTTTNDESKLENKSFIKNEKCIILL